MCYIEPYPVASELSAKRAVARRIGTTYAYDFLGLFEKGVVKEWQVTHLQSNLICCILSLVYYMYI